MLAENPDIRYAGFWPRFWASLIDGLFVLPLVFTVFTPLRLYCLNHRTVLPLLLWQIVSYLFTILLVTRLGGTPGKLLMKLRIVDLSGRFLAFGPAMLRLAPFVLSGVITLVQELLVYGALAPGDHVATMGELSRLRQAHGGGASLFLGLGQFLVILVDVALMLDSPQKRTGHDRLAGSCVIYRDPLPPLPVSDVNV